MSEGDARPHPQHPLDELVVSNMWGMAALVEVLEGKGILTQKEILDAIGALRAREGEGREERGLDGRNRAEPHRTDDASQKPRSSRLRSV